MINVILALCIVAIIWAIVRFIKTTDWLIVDLKLFVWWHLTVPNFFWKLRGLKSCKTHGFYHQSWITGKCSDCELDKTRPPEEKVVRAEVNPEGRKIKPYVIVVDEKSAKRLKKALEKVQ